MNNKRFAASVGALVWAACLACSAREVPTTKETTISPQQVENREIQMKGSLAGIGAVLKKNNDQIVITTVIPGSPAEKTGLKAGQCIAAINAIPTTTMTLEDAVKLVRGPKGTQVELTVVGPLNAKTQRVIIVRDIFTLPVVATTGRLLDNSASASPAPTQPPQSSAGKNDGAIPNSVAPRTPPAAQEENSVYSLQPSTPPANPTETKPVPEGNR